MKKIRLKTRKCASVGSQGRELEKQYCSFLALFGLYNDFIKNSNKILYLQYPIELTIIFYSIT